MNILFIDDAPIRADKLAQTNIVFIAHGFDQIKFYSKGKFDLIMLDHDMPLMNGEEVVREFRDAFVAMNCPVIVHSSNIPASGKMIELLEEYGIDCGYIPNMRDNWEYNVQCFMNENCY